LETCQADLTWSACASDAWECTEPGADESCDVGACSGIRQCGSDCAWGDCAPDCPGGTDCCADGCVDLANDAVNCGECERECLYGEPPVSDPCYSGACATKCCRNNPTELCDDESFWVPSPYVPMYLVCTNGNGGVAYFATESGPECSDNIRRCRCWAENGMDFQDYLPALYIAHMTCTQAGQVLLVDLSPWEGQVIYVGAHEQVDGSGDMTRACVAEGI
jgi:hypothetical protein